MITLINGSASGNRSVSYTKIGLTGFVAPVSTNPWNDLTLLNNRGNRDSREGSWAITNFAVQSFNEQIFPTETLQGSLDEVILINRGLNPFTVVINNTIGAGILQASGEFSNGCVQLGSGESLKIDGPIRTINVIDPSGLGDTVLSAFGNFIRNGNTQ